MAEYIKKDEVIKLIREDKVEITPNLLTIAMLAVPNGYSVEDCYKAINDTCDRHIKEIRNLPGADVVERQRGKWEYKPSLYPYGVEHFECSLCGESVVDRTNFCSNCGADMRGEEHG